MSLQCYDAHKFWISLDDTDFFCIAPTASGSRCRWDISQEDLNEANLCRRNAARMQPGLERDQELQRHVLARLCGDQHREKLSARADQARWCLEDVAIRMSNMMAEPALHAPRSLRNGRQRAALPAARMTHDFRGNLRNRLPLPVRTTYRPTAPILPVAVLCPFVPYLRQPDLPMNIVFQQNAADENQAGKRFGDGYVYIFQWPAHPEFVKIGYTTGNVSDRLWEWTKCHKGLKCVHEEPFAFPKRMEKLIHLELRQWRRKIEICPRIDCGGTHHEWFEIPVRRAIDTVMAWGEVAAVDPIYESRGALTQSWLERVADCEDEITADLLGQLLDEEERALEAQREQERILAEERRLIEERRLKAEEQERRLAEEARRLEEELKSLQAAVASKKAEAIAEAVAPQIAKNVELMVATQSLAPVTQHNVLFASQAVQEAKKGEENMVDEMLAWFTDFMLCLQDQHQTGAAPSAPFINRPSLSVAAA